MLIMKKYTVKLQQFIWRALGLNPKLQAIDNLYYFANQMLDITKFPESGDKDLRLLQKCDAVMLAIFDKVCDRLCYKYFIGWGTLLGAVRHKGFVPWDDDTDTAMMSDDYEDALHKIPEILSPFNIRFEEVKSQKIARAGLSYRHEETGIWVDVFPFQYYRSDMNAQDSFENVTDIVSKYRKEYKKRMYNFNREELLELKKKMIGEGKGANRLVLGNSDFLMNLPIRLYDESVIFPLKKIEFEEYQLNAPAQKEEFLTSIYGNYMTFPKGVLFPHGTGRERPPLSQWAKLHNVDMNEVLSYLNDVYNKI